MFDLFNLNSCIGYGMHVSIIKNASQILKHCTHCMFIYSTELILDSVRLQRISIFTYRFLLCLLAESNEHLFTSRDCINAKTDVHSFLQVALFSHEIQVRAILQFSITFRIVNGFKLMKQLYVTLFRCRWKVVALVQFLHT